MCDEICGQPVESLRLPKGWHSSVRNAVLNVIGILRMAMLTGREALLTNGKAKDARVHQLESEAAMLREELWINCEHFKEVWCKARNILPRCGAVGKHGSVAVVERFHKTMKEILRLMVVPEDQSRFEHEVACIIDWFNDSRPHMTLDGKTPNEVYFSHEPANERLRIEPRKNWPRGSPCAKPQVGVDGDPGQPAIIEIGCLEGRCHLPVIRVRRAA